MKSMTCQFVPHEPAGQFPIPTVTRMSELISKLGGDTPEVRSMIVNDRMIAASNSIANGDFTPEADDVRRLGDVSQQVQKYFVRVKKMDPDTTQSVIVEGTREQSAYSEVRFGLHCMPYVLFPGKVFGLRGLQKLHDQQYITAQGVTSGCPPHTKSFLRNERQKSSTASKQRTSLTDTTDSPFKVLISCGPYSDNIKTSLSIIGNLVQQAALKRASVLFAIGPFTGGDIVGNNPLQDEEYLEDFMGQMKLPKGFKVVLVPSIDDPFCQYVFPQPQHNFTLGDVDGVVRLTNPGYVKVNGVLFGVTSHDVVKHMKNTMIFERGTDSSFSQPAVATTHPMKMYHRIAINELLSSASLYPITPPDVNTPLDLSLCKLLDFQDGMPDVLILRTSIPFCECFHVGTDQSAGDHVICVNPGNFIDSKTLIEFTVSPDPLKLDHIWKRTSVTFHVTS
eukprot:TRINITY_DN15504_c0_g1_i1.p1 TRINITY_DN15504_c0_g1~~TRINITY_DN15504_c0_g1_i1.p1  ORF type:complete len:450 (+),score=66.72 TRINITY_DN15504_c0_g1_i1:62-1411(+)